jgi:hypothetical protein
MNGLGFIQSRQRRPTASDPARIAGSEAQTIPSLKATNNLMVIVARLQRATN